MMLSPVEHFMRTGYGLMMRSSKISTESIGLACAKLVRFLLSQNFCNLTPAIEDDLALINALNSCISLGKRRLPPKATDPPKHGIQSDSTDGRESVSLLCESS